MWLLKRFSPKKKRSDGIIEGFQTTNGGATHHLCEEGVIAYNQLLLSIVDSDARQEYVTGVNEYAREARSAVASFHKAEGTSKSQAIRAQSKFDQLKPALKKIDDKSEFFFQIVSAHLPQSWRAYLTNLLDVLIKNPRSVSATQLDELKKLILQVWGKEAGEYIHASTVNHYFTAFWPELFSSENPFVGIKTKLQETLAILQTIPVDVLRQDYCTVAILSYGEFILNKLSSQDTLEKKLEDFVKSLDGIAPPEGVIKSLLELVVAIKDDNKSLFSEKLSALKATYMSCSPAVQEALRKFSTVLSSIVTRKDFELQHTALFPVQNSDFLLKFKNFEQQCSSNNVDIHKAMLRDASAFIYTRFIYSPEDLIKQKNLIEKALVWCHEALRELLEYPKLDQAILEKELEEQIKQLNDLKKVLATEMLVMLEHLTERNNFFENSISTRLFAGLHFATKGIQSGFTCPVERIPEYCDTFFDGKYFGQFIEYIENNGTRDEARRANNSKVYTKLNKEKSEVLGIQPVAFGYYPLPEPPSPQPVREASVTQANSNSSLAAQSSSASGNEASSTRTSLPTPQILLPKGDQFKELRSLVPLTEPTVVEYGVNYLSAKAIYEFINNSKLGREFFTLIGYINHALTTERNAPVRGDENEIYPAIVWLNKAEQILAAEKKAAKGFTIDEKFTSEINKIIEKNTSVVNDLKIKVAKKLFKHTEQMLLLERRQRCSLAVLNIHKKFIIDHANEHAEQLGKVTNFLNNFLARLGHDFSKQKENNAIDFVLNPLEEKGPYFDRTKPAVKLDAVSRDAGLCVQYLDPVNDSGKIRAVRIVAAIITAEPSLEDPVLKFPWKKLSASKAANAIDAIQAELISAIKILFNNDETVTLRFLQQIVGNHVFTGQKLVDLTDQQIKIMKAISPEQYSYHMGTIGVACQDCIDLLDDLKREDFSGFTANLEKKSAYYKTLKDGAPVLDTATYLINLDSQYKEIYNKKLSEFIRDITSLDDKRLVYLERFLACTMPRPDDQLLSEYRFKLLDLYYTPKPKRVRDEIISDKLIQATPGGNLVESTHEAWGLQLQFRQQLLLYFVCEYPVDEKNEIKKLVEYAQHSVNIKEVSLLRLTSLVISGENRPDIREAHEQLLYFNSVYHFLKYVIDAATFENLSVGPVETGEVVATEENVEKAIATLKLRRNLLADQIKSLRALVSCKTQENKTGAIKLALSASCLKFFKVHLPLDLQKEVALTALTYLLRYPHLISQYLHAVTFIQELLANSDISFNEEEISLIENAFSSQYQPAKSDEVPWNGATFTAWPVLRALIGPLHSVLEQPDPITREYLHSLSPSLPEYTKRIVGGYCFKRMAAIFAGNADYPQVDYKLLKEKFDSEFKTLQIIFYTCLDQRQQQELTNLCGGGNVFTRDSAKQAIISRIGSDSQIQIITKIVGGEVGRDQDPTYRLLLDAIQNLNTKEDGAVGLRTHIGDCIDIPGERVYATNARVILHRDLFFELVEISFKTNVEGIISSSAEPGQLHLNSMFLHNAIRLLEGVWPEVKRGWEQISLKEREQKKSKHPKELAFKKQLFDYLKAIPHNQVLHRLELKYQVVYLNFIHEYLDKITTEESQEKARDLEQKLKDDIAAAPKPKKEAVQAEQLVKLGKAIATIKLQSVAEIEQGKKENCAYIRKTWIGFVLAIPENYFVVEQTGERVKVLINPAYCHSFEAKEFKEKIKSAYHFSFAVLGEKGFYTSLGHGIVEILAAHSKLEREQLEAKAAAEKAGRSFTPVPELQRWHWRCIAPILNVVQEIPNAYKDLNEEIRAYLASLLLKREFIAAADLVSRTQALPNWSMALKDLIEKQYEDYIKEHLLASISSQASNNESVHDHWQNFISALMKMNIGNDPETLAKANNFHDKILNCLATGLGSEFRKETVNLTRGVNAMFTVAIFAKDKFNRGEDNADDCATRLAQILRDKASEKEGYRQIIANKINEAKQSNIVRYEKSPDDIKNQMEEWQIAFLHKISRVLIEERKNRIKEMREQRAKQSAAQREISQSRDGFTAAVRQILPAGWFALGEKPALERIQSLGMSIQERSDTDQKSYGEIFYNRLLRSNLLNSMDADLTHQDAKTKGQALSVLRALMNNPVVKDLLGADVHNVTAYLNNQNINIEDKHRALQILRTTVVVPVIKDLMNPNDVDCVVAYLNTQEEINRYQVIQYALREILQIGEVKGRLVEFYLNLNKKSYQDLVKQHQEQLVRLNKLIRKLSKLKVKLSETEIRKKLGSCFLGDEFALMNERKIPKQFIIPSSESFEPEMKEGFSCRVTKTEAEKTYIDGQERETGMTIHYVEYSRFINPFRISQNCISILGTPSAPKIVHTPNSSSAEIVPPTPVTFSQAAEKPTEGELKFKAFISQKGLDTRPGLKFVLIHRGIKDKLIKHWDGNNNPPELKVIDSELAVPNLSLEGAFPGLSQIFFGKKDQFTGEARVLIPLLKDAKLLLVGDCRFEYFMAQDKVKAFGPLYELFLTHYSAILREHWEVSNLPVEAAFEGFIAELASLRAEAPREKTEEEMKQEMAASIAEGKKIIKEINDENLRIATEGQRQGLAANIIKSRQEASAASIRTRVRERQKAETKRIQQLGGQISESCRQKIISFASSGNPAITAKLQNRTMGAVDETEFTRSVLGWARYLVFLNAIDAAIQDERNNPNQDKFNSLLRFKSILALEGIKKEFILRWRDHALPATADGRIITDPVDLQQKHLFPVIANYMAFTPFVDAVMSRIPPLWQEFLRIPEVSACLRGHLVGSVAFGALGGQEQIDNFVASITQLQTRFQANFSQNKDQAITAIATALFGLSEGLDRLKKTPALVSVVERILQSCLPNAPAQSELRVFVDPEADLKKYIAAFNDASEKLKVKRPYLFGILEGLLEKLNRYLGAVDKAKTSTEGLDEKSRKAIEEARAFVADNREEVQFFESYCRGQEKPFAIFDNCSSLDKSLEGIEDISDVKGVINKHFQFMRLFELSEENFYLVCNECSYNRFLESLTGFERYFFALDITKRALLAFLVRNKKFVTKLTKAEIESFKNTQINKRKIMGDILMQHRIDSYTTSDWKDRRSYLCSLLLTKDQAVVQKLKNYYGDINNVCRRFDELPQLDKLLFAARDATSIAQCLDQFFFKVVALRTTSEVVKNYDPIFSSMDVKNLSALFYRIANEAAYGQVLKLVESSANEYAFYAQDVVRDKLIVLLASRNLLLSTFVNDLKTFEAKIAPYLAELKLENNLQDCVTAGLAAYPSLQKLFCASVITYDKDGEEQPIKIKDSWLRVSVRSGLDSSRFKEKLRAYSAALVQFTAYLDISGKTISDELEFLKDTVAEYDNNVSPILTANGNVFDTFIDGLLSAPTLASLFEIIKLLRSNVVLKNEFDQAGRVHDNYVKLFSSAIAFENLLNSLRLKSREFKYYYDFASNKAAVQGCFLSFHAMRLWVLQGEQPAQSGMKNPREVFISQLLDELKKSHKALCVQDPDSHLVEFIADAISQKLFANVKDASPANVREVITNYKANAKIANLERLIIAEARFFALLDLLKDYPNLTDILSTTFIREMLTEHFQAHSFSDLTDFLAAISRANDVISVRDAIARHLFGKEVNLLSITSTDESTVRSWKLFSTSERWKLLNKDVVSSAIGETRFAIYMRNPGFDRHPTLRKIIESKKQELVAIWTVCGVPDEINFKDLDEKLINIDDTKSILKLLDDCLIHHTDYQVFAKDKSAETAKLEDMHAEAVYQILCENFKDEPQFRKLLDDMWVRGNVMEYIKNISAVRSEDKYQVIVNSGAAKDGLQILLGQAHGNVKAYIKFHLQNYLQTVKIRLAEGLASADIRALKDVLPRVAFCLSEGDERFQGNISAPAIDLQQALDLIAEASYLEFMARDGFKQRPALRHFFSLAKVRTILIAAWRKKLVYKENSLELDPQKIFEKTSNVPAWFISTTDNSKLDEIFANENDVTELLKSLGREFVYNAKAFENVPEITNLILTNILAEARYLVVERKEQIEEADIVLLKNYLANEKINESFAETVSKARFAEFSRKWPQLKIFIDHEPLKSALLDHWKKNVADIDFTDLAIKLQSAHIGNAATILLSALLSKDNLADFSISGGQLLEIQSHAKLYRYEQQLNTLAAYHSSLSSLVKIPAVQAALVHHWQQPNKDIPSIDKVKQLLVKLSAIDLSQKEYVAATADALHDCFEINVDIFVTHTKDLCGKLISEARYSEFMRMIDVVRHADLVQFIKVEPQPLYVTEVLSDNYRLVSNDYLVVVLRDEANRNALVEYFRTQQVPNNLTEFYNTIKASAELQRFPALIVAIEKAVNIQNIAAKFMREKFRENLLRDTENTAFDVLTKADAQYSVFMKTKEIREHSELVEALKAQNVLDQLTQSERDELLSSGQPTVSNFLVKMLTDPAIEKIFIEYFKNEYLKGKKLPGNLREFCAVIKADRDLSRNLTLINVVDKAIRVQEIITSFIKLRFSSPAYTNEDRENCTRLYLIANAKEYKAHLAGEVIKISAESQKVDDSQKMSELKTEQAVLRKADAVYSVLEHAQNADQLFAVFSSKLEEEANARKLLQHGEMCLESATALQIRISVWDLLSKKTINFPKDIEKISNRLRAEPAHLMNDGAVAFLKAAACCQDGSFVTANQLRSIFSLMKGMFFQQFSDETKRQITKFRQVLNIFDMVGWWFDAKIAAGPIERRVAITTLQAFLKKDTEANGLYAKALYAYINIPKVRDMIINLEEMQEVISFEYYNYLSINLIKNLHPSGSQGDDFEEGPTLAEIIAKFKYALNFLDEALENEGSVSQFVAPVVEHLELLLSPRNVSRESREQYRSRIIEGTNFLKEIFASKSWRSDSASQSCKIFRQKVIAVAMAAARECINQNRINVFVEMFEVVHDSNERDLISLLANQLDLTLSNLFYESGIEDICSLLKLYPYLDETSQAKIEFFIENLYLTARSSERCYSSPYYHPVLRCWIHHLFPKNADFMLYGKSEPLTTSTVREVNGKSEALTTSTVREANSKSEPLAKSTLLEAAQKGTVELSYRNTTSLHEDMLKVMSQQDHLLFLQALNKYFESNFQNDLAVIGRCLQAYLPFADAVKSRVCQWVMWQNLNDFKILKLIMSLSRLQSREDIKVKFDYLCFIHQHSEAYPAALEKAKSFWPSEKMNWFDALAEITRLQINAEEANAKILGYDSSAGSSPNGSQESSSHASRSSSAVSLLASSARRPTGAPPLAYKPGSLDNVLADSLAAGILSPNGQSPSQELEATSSDDIGSTPRGASTPDTRTPLASPVGSLATTPRTPSSLTVSPQPRSSSRRFLDATPGKDSLWGSCALMLAAHACDHFEIKDKGKDKRREKEKPVALVKIHHRYNKDLGVFTSIDFEPFWKDIIRHLDTESNGTGSKEIEKTLCPILKKIAFRYLMESNILKSACKVDVTKRLAAVCQKMIIQNKEAKDLDFSTDLTNADLIGLQDKFKPVVEKILRVGNINASTEPLILKDCAKILDNDYFENLKNDKATWPNKLVVNILAAVLQVKIVGNTSEVTSNVDAKGALVLDLFYESRTDQNQNVISRECHPRWNSAAVAVTPTPAQLSPAPVPPSPQTASTPSVVLVPRT